MNTKLTFEGYADVDWAGDTTDRKSLNGYLFQHGGNTISWPSKKQMYVALSSSETAYVFAANAFQKVVC